MSAKSPKIFSSTDIYFAVVSEEINGISLISSLTQLFNIIEKLVLLTNEIQDRAILPQNIILYTRLTYVKPDHNILGHFCTKMQF